MFPGFPDVGTALFATSTWAATREEVLRNFYAGWIGNRSGVQLASSTVSSSQPQPSNETSHPSKSTGFHSVDFRNFDAPFTCEERMRDRGACDAGFDRVVHVSNGEWRKESQRCMMSKLRSGSRSRAMKVIHSAQVAV